MVPVDQGDAAARPDRTLIMCLAVPARIVEIDSASDMATVALGEVKKVISLALVDAVEVGDYVLIHVGYALNKLDPEEAEKTLQLFAEAGMLNLKTSVDR